VTWQILIPTIPHRHDKLCALLAVLDAQVQPGVRVLVYRDNLQVSYAGKLQALYDAATADYVSSLADDDSVSPVFVTRVMDAIARSRPDQVGFRVLYTEAGVRQMPVIHSITTPGWGAGGAGLFRDHCYYNPVRRELAQQVKFRGPYCDEEWAEDLRNLGIIKTEEFIDEEIFWYQRNPADNFHSARQPFPEDAIPPLPRYPWLDVLDA
jgi:hypothetical protein